MFLEIIILIVLLLIIIRYEIRNNERIIINMVLSKLNFSHKYHKIIRKDNKIYIKCHNYSTVFSHLLLNNIKKNKDGYYYINQQKLINYDPTKNIGIIVYDIMIDMKKRKYKIITTYFQIINLIRDDGNNYFKIITS